MAFVRKIKPGELYELPSGDFIRNTTGSSIRIAFIKKDETRDAKRIETRLNGETKNEHKPSK